MREPLTRLFLRFTLVLLCTLVLSPFSYADEAAGKVISVRGTLYAIGTNNVKRELGLHDQFYEGDTLITGPITRAQVLFTDGSLVALPAASKLRIDNYHYSNKKKNSYVITLIQGAFRTITGAISKADPNNYLVQTPVSTIGVRGTFFATEVNPGAELVCVKRGRIFIKNHGGSLDLGEGARYGFAIVPSLNKAPQGSDESPEFLFKYFRQHLYSGLTPNIANDYNGHRTPVLDQDVYYQNNAYLFVTTPSRLNTRQVRVLLLGGQIP